MEHDLVAMHFGRRLGPMLSIILVPLFRDLVVQQLTTAPGSMCAPAVLRVRIMNDGKRIARYIRLTLEFHGSATDLQINITGYAQLWQDIGNLNSGRRLYQYVDNVGVVHPMSPMVVGEFQLVFSNSFVEGNADRPLATWTIFADESQPYSGVVSFADLHLILLPAPKTVTLVTTATNR